MTHQRVIYQVINNSTGRVVGYRFTKKAAYKFADSKETGGRYIFVVRKYKLKEGENA